MRFVIIALLIGLALPTFAQDRPPLTDDYQFNDISFRTPADWQVFSNNNEFHVFNFDGGSLDFKYSDLEPGQMQMILSVSAATSENLPDVTKKDFLLGFLTGRLTFQMQMQRAITGDFTYELLGFQVDDWLILEATTNVNDFIVMVKEAEFLTIVVLITPKGELMAALGSAFDVGDSLQAAD